MKWVIVLLLLSAALLLWRVWRPTRHLTIGDHAPGFELSDQLGNKHTLANYRGSWVVLFFYPRDDTPGCTREACEFRDALPSLKTLHAQVIGISVDDAASHARFAEKLHLPFTLLADTQGMVAAQYGALIKLGPIKMARRMTFLIAPQGHIAHVFRKVNPSRHASDVLRILEDIQHGVSSI